MGIPLPENQEPLEPRTEEDWRNVVNRLRYFTYKYYHWLPLKVIGVDLDGLIHDAIVDTLTGRRHRPPDVSLVTFLTNVIRSKASHLLDREKKVVSIEDISPARPTTSGESSYLFRPEEKEKQSVFQQMCRRLREVVDGDEVLCKIVDLWLENPDLKPREIARKLGISADELRSAQKRLSRRAKELREEWQNVYGR